MRRALLGLLFVSATAFAQVDAGQITKGTLAPGRIPAPTSTTLGGVKGSGGLLTCGAGSMQNGFASDGSITCQSKPVIEARDIVGVDCTGVADSSAALTAFTGNPPSTNNSITGKTLSFGSCSQIKVTTPWVVYNQAGFLITGLTRSGAASKGPNFVWAGGVTGPMIDMEYVDGFKVEGLNLNGGANATIGLQIDKNGAGGVWNTTDGRFSDSTFQGANQNWIGVLISPVSTQNVEDIRIENSSFYCNAARATTAAIGIKIGNSANAKNEIFYHNGISSCFYGIYQLNGSMQVLDNELSANGGTCATGGGADIRIDTTTDPDLIQGNLDENSLQGISTNNDSSSGGPGHPVIVRGNHAAPAGCENTAKYWYNTPSGVGWLFDGNSWDPDAALTKVIGTANPVTLINVHTAGNVYPNATFAPWWLNGFRTDSAELEVMTSRLLPGFTGATNHSPASSFLDFRAYLNSGTSQPDDVVLQNIPAGGNGTSGGTFLIKHQQGATGTEMFGWDGSYPGIAIAQLSTPPAPIAISVQGTSGGTTYTYAVVAYGPTGNTPASPTLSTAIGNATLTTSNFNRIQYYGVAGAVKYCFYRTVGGATQGNIGCVSAFAFGHDQLLPTYGYTVNTHVFNNNYQFDDTGLTGDLSSLPTTNTTGGLSVAGLCMNCTGVYETGILTSDKLYTNIQALIAGAATHTLANSFTYTSSATFQCQCTDQTAAAACKAVPASATTVTVAGTGTDSIALSCSGH